MATTRIAYNNPQTATGTQVAEFVDAVMVALAKGRRLKAQFLAMNSDNAAIAAELGMVAGTTNGTDLWFVLNQGIAAIDVTAVTTELARLDQGG